MIRLLKIEWTKLSTYRPFWVLTICYLLLSPLLMFSVHHIKFPGFPNVAEMFYAFPMGWNVAAWTASWFQILLGIMFVIFISNEFNFKTTRQHVIDGLTRNEYFLSKLLLIGMMAVFATFYMVLNAIIGSYLFANGLDNIAEGTEYIPIFLFQTIGYLSVALLFSFLLRKSGYAILIYICVIVGEFIIRNIISENGAEMLALYSPIGIISNLTPIPFLEAMLDGMAEMQGEKPLVLSLSERLSGGSAYILLYISISYISFKRKMI